MSITYNYEIISVDEAARCMEVVYTAEGHKTMRIGTRLPYADEALEAVVAQFSPVAYWLEQTRELAVPQVGVTGVVAPQADQTVGEQTSPAATINDRLSVLDFIARFTQEEQLAVTAASLESAEVRNWYDKLIAAQYVDLNDPRLAAGLAALVAYGLLTQQRVDEVMSIQAGGASPEMVINNIEI